MFPQWPPIKKIQALKKKNGKEKINERNVLDFQNL